MSGLLLDTDVLVDHLRGVPGAVRYFRENAERVHLSVISIAELFAGVRDGEERDALSALRSSFPCLPIDVPIAERAGLFKREFAHSHRVGIADCLIAATAMNHGLTLQTLNTKQFPMFKGLKAPYRKS